MKKMVGLLLLLAMILISGTVIAETSSDTGIWMYCPYMDEFNQPTDEYYVRNEELITGIFSNPSTVDSPLGVWVFVLDGEHVVIRLLEHGSSLVYNSTSKDKYYSMTVKDSDGERCLYSAYMNSGSNELIFGTKENDKLIRTLCESKAVSFSINRENKEKYIFTIEDTTGLFDMLPYIHTNSASEGLEIVKKAGKYGFMDASDNLVIPCEFDGIEPFSNGLAKVQKVIGASNSTVWSEKYGYIDTSGNLVIPCDYSDLGIFSEGLAYVRMDGKYGYIDTTGEIVIPCEFSEARSFIDGRAVIATGNYNSKEYGIIDTTGKIVVEPQYKWVGEFSEGVAVVKSLEKPSKYNNWKTSHKYGYINTKGELVIPCRYDEANPFFLGEASVRLNGEYIRIDHNGNTTVSSDRLITMPSW